MPVISDPVRAFLQSPRFAVAATIAADGTPHQTVVWYLLEEGDEVLINTPEASVKHKHLLRDPRLSLCIEDGFRYVTLVGKTTMDTDEEREVYRRMGRHYLGATVVQPNSTQPVSDPKVAELLSRERVTIRMTIERVIANGLE